MEAIDSTLLTKNHTKVRTVHRKTEKGWRRGHHEKRKHLLVADPEHHACRIAEVVLSLAAGADHQIFGLNESDGHVGIDVHVHNGLRLFSVTAETGSLGLRVPSTAPDSPVLSSTREAPSFELPD